MGRNTQPVAIQTVESLGVSKLNHLGEIRYILSVNNLPSHIRDTRKEPITIKARSATHSSHVLYQQERDRRPQGAES